MLSSVNKRLAVPDGATVLVGALDERTAQELVEQEGVGCHSLRAVKAGSDCLLSRSYEIRDDTLDLLGGKRSGRAGRDRTFNAGGPPCIDRSIGGLSRARGDRHLRKHLIDLIFT